MMVRILAMRLPPLSDPAKSQFFLLCKSLHNRNYAKLGIMRRYRGGSSTAAVSATTIST